MLGLATLSMTTARMPPLRRPKKICYKNTICKVEEHVESLLRLGAGLDDPQYWQNGLLVTTVREWETPFETNLKDTRTRLWFKCLDAVCWTRLKSLTKATQGYNLDQTPRNHNMM